MHKVGMTVTYNKDTNGGFMQELNYNVMEVSFVKGAKLLAYLNVNGGLVINESPELIEAVAKALSDYLLGGDIAIQEAKAAIRAINQYLAGK